MAEKTQASEVVRLLRDASRMYEVFSEAHEVAAFLATREKYIKELDNQEKALEDEINKQKNILSNIGQEIDKAKIKVSELEKEGYAIISRAEKAGDKLVEDAKKEVEDARRLAAATLSRIKEETAQEVAKLSEIKSRTKQANSIEAQITAKIDKLKSELSSFLE